MTQCTELCKAFIHGKVTRGTNFKARVSLAPNVIDIVHTGVFEKLSILSIGGSLHFVSIFDDYKAFQSIPVVPDTQKQAIIQVHN